MVGGGLSRGTHRLLYIQVVLRAASGVLWRAFSCWTAVGTRWTGMCVSESLRATEAHPTTIREGNSCAAARSAINDLD